VTRRLAALAVAVSLAVAPLVSSQPAAGRLAEPQGSSGIGDPYFPLDGNGGIDVLSYDVHDRYDFATGRLSGRTKVTLRTTKAVSSFNLDFLLPVRSVTVGGREATFTKKRHELVVRGRRSASEVVRVVVRYAGNPGDYSYTGESNWLADGKEVVAMNQPHMAPWWFPANDHPRDRAQISISITVPKDKQVIANGRLVKREVNGPVATTTWRADEPMVPYLAFFAAGRFDVDRSSEGGRPSYVAVSKQLNPVARNTAMSLMKQTPGLLRWVEESLGDYPFSVTGGLTTGLGVGFALENQTRPTYPFMGSGSGAVETVVHELAHQWFGDSVTVHGWKDIWLNEGPATFFEALYDEHHAGPSADEWLRTTYDGIDAGEDFWKHEVADPCPTHTNCVHSIFAGFVYDRGAMTLQALRNVIGDDDFFALLRTWVTVRAGQTARTEQFQALAEDIAGRDLDAFFHAWVHTSSKPADVAANGLGGPS
jgi:aminopeptidase N